MDIKIEKKKSIKKYILNFGFLAAFAGVAYYFISGFSGKSSYTVDASRLSFTSVKEGIFEEKIPVNGIVEPLKVVFLDAIQGGMVDEIYVSQGEFVKAGQPLLRFKNIAFQLDVFSQEARISEQLDINANTRLTLDKNELDLRTKLNDIDYLIKDLSRQLKSKTKLYEQKFVSKDEFDSLKDEYEYNIRYRDIVKEAQEQERSIRDIKIQQLKDSEQRLNEHLKIIRASLNGLVVQAPISGLLSSLDIEVGESKNKGSRLGQIDRVDGFKVVSSVDAFYTSRIQLGKTAVYSGLDKPTGLSVSKIYPEVKNGVFLVDLDFQDKPPEGLRRGQNIIVDLSLGVPKETLLIRNGAFFSDTGGNWVFVLSKDGHKASKREVRLGKRNAKYIEVIGGLTAGEKIITSAYENFKDKDLLRIKGS